MQYFTSFNTGIEKLLMPGIILSNWAVASRHDLPVTNDENAQKYHKLWNANKPECCPQHNRTVSSRQQDRTPYNASMEVPSPLLIVVRYIL